MTQETSRSLRVTIPFFFISANNSWAAGAAADCSLRSGRHTTGASRPAYCSLTNWSVSTSFLNAERTLSGKGRFFWDAIMQPIPFAQLFAHARWQLSTTWGVQNVQNTSQSCENPYWWKLNCVDYFAVVLHGWPILAPLVLA